MECGLFALLQSENVIDIRLAECRSYKIEQTQVGIRDKAGIVSNEPDLLPLFPLFLAAVLSLEIKLNSSFSSCSFSGSRLQISIGTGKPEDNRARG